MATLVGKGIPFRKERLLTGKKWQSHLLFEKTAGRGVQPSCFKTPGDDNIDEMLWKKLVLHTKGM